MTKTIQQKGREWGRWGKKHAGLICFWLIISAGAALRLYHLGELPAMLHRDEASIGYNAYALLVSGHDEHGHGWPLNFAAFGEYKLPGLIYLTVPAIRVLGLTELAVRLPTAIVGMATLPALYWLCREMGWSKKVALLAMALLAVSFWHVTASRNAYEPILGLSLSVIGIASWLRARRQPGFFLLAGAVCLGGGLAYNVTWLYLPFLLLVMTVVRWRDYKRRLSWVGGGVALIVAATIGVALILGQVNQNRSQATIFFQEELVGEAERNTHAALINGLPYPVAKLLNHPWGTMVKQGVNGYLSAFDPTFLFTMGDENPWHNLRSINWGNFNPLLIVGLIWGGAELGRRRGSGREQSAAQITLVYVLTAPLFNAMTIAPSINRLLDFHLALVIMMAVGVRGFYRWWREGRQAEAGQVGAQTAVSAGQARRPMANQWRWLFGSWIAVTIWVSGYFWSQYYFVYNQTLHPLWQSGAKEMITRVGQIEDQYEQIYTQDFDLAYIFYAFYLGWDPVDFAARAGRYQSGFDQVATYGKYHFADGGATLAELRAEPELPKTLLVTKCAEVTDGVMGAEVVWQIDDFWGECQWRAISLGGVNSRRVDSLENINYDE